MSDARAAATTPASHEPRVRLARMWLRAGQPLGAAALLAELALDNSRDPEVWTGLGAALLGARGQLVRKPFEQWAARVFRQATPLVRGTPFAEVCAHWVAQLPPPTTDDPIEAAELDALLGFLLVTEDVMPAAVEGLPPDDRMLAVMVLGDHSRLAAPVLRAAILGRWGAPAARAALKRVGRFLHRIELRAALRQVAATPAGAELEPYLGWTLDKLNG